MTDGLSIVYDATPRASDIAQVRAGLMAFNEESVGPVTVLPIALYLRDEHDTIRGGLTGYLAWDWLSVDLLWVMPPVLLYWISHLWLAAQRGHMTDDPLVFAVKDRVSLVLIGLMGATAWLAV